MKVVARIAISVVVVLVLGVLSIAGYAAIDSGHQVNLPTPSGPFAVGRTLYDWTDGSRHDPYAASSSTPRELTVLVWYPTTPTPSARATSYLPPGWSTALGSRWLDDLTHTKPGNLHPHAVEDAPVAGDARYPVVVLAPGLGLQAADYSALAEDLASHGFVVAGLNPTFSTDVVLSGGRVVRSVPNAGDSADLDSLAKVWADDMSFVATEMSNLDSDPGVQFAGRLLVSHIGFAGHSLGGAAATLACRHDSRCAAAIDLDGDLHGDVLQTGLGKPFLFLGSEDTLTSEPNLARMLRGVEQGIPSANRHFFTVAGARHDNFTDRGLYFNLFFAQLGVIGSIDGARALQIAGTSIRSFLGSYLSGQDANQMSRLQSTFPELHAASI